MRRGVRGVEEWTGKPFLHKGPPQAPPKTLKCFVPPPASRTIIMNRHSSKISG
jgi:hypothetical protein